MSSTVRVQPPGPTPMPRTHTQKTHLWRGSRPPAADLPAVLGGLECIELECIEHHTGTTFLDLQVSHGLALEGARRVCVTCLRPTLCCTCCCHSSVLMQQVWMGADARLLAHSWLEKLAAKSCGSVKWLLMVGVRFPGSTDASWLREAVPTGWNELHCADRFGCGH